MSFSGAHILPLSDEHRQALRDESWLTDDLIDAAEIGEVDDANGRLLIGQRSKQGDFAGLVFPYRLPGDPNVRGYHYGDSTRTSSCKMVT
jgi:hypothetical protein